ncbi:MAG: RsmD family RNA methyltransferase [Bacteroidales bacterium]
MRIICGSHRSRRIIPPNGLPVRPTTDLAKESLFNILNNRIDFDEISVLDLFSGTGNISYEFASRGATEIMAVELNPKCAAFIEKSAEALGFKIMSIIQTNVFTFLPVIKRKFDLIFADPPFESEDISKLPDLIFTHNLLAPDGWVVIEHPRNVKFQAHPNFTEHRQYGKVNFSFFRNVEDQS